MYVVLLAGGLASGKSTVACELARRGARRVDLDRLSRDVLAPGAATTAAVAATFGHDLVDAAGRLDRARLARRAFATPADTARLEAIELPAIRDALVAELGAARADGAACAVVEVPLLDRATDLVPMADEVVAVCCPRACRLARAVARGMSEADARARMANQPADDWLRAHADTVIENVGTPADLLAAVAAWWDARPVASHASQGVRHGS